ncbi:hypothetical protein CLG96_10405 [Sphingomonas oleivorans]|uniref:ATP-dependent RNA helicase n=1 Tax=Sphingomonas oleivorans TaxID=1735121 RepID=A0A2T5FXJ3_9SPHN|nr:RcnB family protein [Sphingomonas oleivorans]PTQ10804.1 hypothetical protein CLG96_10405 [Sphingomonas oleivorans]
MVRTLTALLLAATAAIPTVASAQTPSPRPEHDRRDRDWREEQRDDRRDWNEDRGQERRDWREDRHDERGDWQENQRDWEDDRREDRQDWRDDRREGRDWRDDRRWDRDWRNDRRYDWQRWRERNRPLYRAPRYYPPRGYDHGYRRWVPGHRIPRYYYGRPYWIVDPWQYRLPPAYGRYRWVRYHDDVMLVDITDGIIRDIIHSFFW